MNNNYVLGSELMSVIVPPSNTDKIFDIKVSDNLDKDDRKNKNGIDRFDELVEQKAEVRNILNNEKPDELIIIGGDCSVSEEPFEYLIKKYDDKFGILWLDAHPDIQEVVDSNHYHEMVLADLLGMNNDNELTKVNKAIDKNKILYVGLIEENMRENEHKIYDLGLKVLNPKEFKQGTDKVLNWIKENNIKYLAVHWDLDVLSPNKFRSVGAANPELKPGEYGAAIGELEIEEVVNLLIDISKEAKIVGFTIAEHLPWDALNLRRELGKLEIFKN